MGELGLNRQTYGRLSVSDRALYLARDRIDGWFQSLMDDAAIKEMKKKNAQNRNARR